MFIRDEASLGNIQGNYARYIMKKLLLTAFLLAITISASASSNSSAPTFCEWLGDAATAIAQNRDNGIEEYDLIGKYLSESKSYGEQSIVIPLIDRVYGIERGLEPDEVAFAEQQRCEVAFIRLTK